MVPGPGLEPGYSASKADVLPIRRSRNSREKFSRQVSIRPSGRRENIGNGESPAKCAGGSFLLNWKTRYGVLWRPAATRCSDDGEVAERFKAHAWKACVG